MGQDGRVGATRCRGGEGGGRWTMQSDRHGWLPFFAGAQWSMHFTGDQNHAYTRPYIIHRLSVAQQNNTNTIIDMRSV